MPARKMSTWLLRQLRMHFTDGCWSRLAPAERSKALWKLADLLEQHVEEFAKLESENTGKPYKFVSLGADLLFSIDNLRFFAGAARDTHGSHAGEFMPGYTSMYRREPVGVVGQIAPWNYPLMMGVWKDRHGSCRRMYNSLQTRFDHSVDELDAW